MVPDYPQNRPCLTCFTAPGETLLAVVFDPRRKIRRHPLSPNSSTSFFGFVKNDLRKSSGLAGGLM
jgi:hypothetical protein